MKATIQGYFSVLLLGGMLTMLMGMGCPKKSDLPVTSNPEKNTPIVTVSPVRFRNVATEVGLDYEWKPLGKRPLTILQTIGNGCAFLDYNNDGNLDILLVGQQPSLF
jgi:hypothetical protein